MEWGRLLLLLSLLLLLKVLVILTGQTISEMSVEAKEVELMGTTIDA